MTNLCPTYQARGLFTKVIPATHYLFRVLNGFLQPVLNFPAAGCDEDGDPVVVPFCIRGNLGHWFACRHCTHRGLLQMPAQTCRQRSPAGEHEARAKQAVLQIL